MWNHLSFDLLTKIFTLLPPDSLACVESTCKDWQKCIKSYYSSSIPHLMESRCNPPWFLAMITSKNYGHCCYAYNSVLDRWYLLSLDFLPHPIHPIAPICSLILCRLANSSVLQLALYNPFTKQYKSLPPLNILRTTPAVGVIEASSSSFRIFVAGGMSASSKGCSGSGGGASYEPTLEMYDLKVNKWQTIGLMPNIFAVRLTVWTPNESVYLMGILYWITSARAYSIMGFDVNSRLWKEVNVPMADKLEFAALVRRKEQLTLIGGKIGEEACIWELGLGDIWNLVDRVPVELGKKFTGSKGSWCSTKCVGTDKAIYLYKNLGSKMLVWMEVKENASKWEWFWVGGYCSIKGQQVPNFPVKGLLLHPDLAPSSILTSV
ncbi:hypothetical protein FRX31_018081 [Thalictrum thalictroides]|uniref:F-box/kelch-repeat protein n=1 Tax=Thalictrum thalictroides TaxID=46969 RepID=A0A7J6W4L9_THATH|nr:hypothetical protein FRX31_018081 [Thalictrum thalictroides]